MRSIVTTVTETVRRMYGMTQYEIVRLVVREATGWVPSSALRSRETRWGWLGNGDRRARELAQQGVLRRRIRNGEAEYRYE